MKADPNFNPFAKDPEAEIKRRLVNGKKISREEFFKRLKEIRESVQKRSDS